MNLDSLNKWLTLLANLGVVAGLFALVLELDQSSRMADVSAFQNRMTEMQQTQVQIATDEDLAALLYKYEVEGLAALSPAEAVRVRAWYTGVLLRMQGQYYQYQQGFLGRASIDITLDTIANRRYANWEELGLLDNIILPEWRSEIEARLRQAQTGQQPGS